MSQDKMADQDTLARKTVKKYLFDLHNFDEDFDDAPAEEEELPPPPPPPPTFSVAELEHAKRDSYESGKRDGRVEADASREKHVSALLDTIKMDVMALLQAETARAALYEAEAVALTRSIFTKLFPALNERHGLAEIEHFIRQVLEEHKNQPEIRIEVHPDYQSDIESYVQTMMATSYEAGTWTVIGQPLLGPGDCRLSWAQGGATRHIEDVSAEIQKILDQTLADKPLLRDNDTQDTTSDGLQGASDNDQPSAPSGLQPGPQPGHDNGEIT